MDALTLVRQDHRKLEGLLERCRRLDGEPGVERALLLDQLQAALRHHVDQEESILYTIFRERARQAEVDQAPLDQALEQHRLIERLWRELTDAGPGGPTSRAKLTALVEQVRTHLDTEDATLLTALEAELDDPALLDLGRRLENRRRVVAAQEALESTTTDLLPKLRRGVMVVAATAAAIALAAIARRRRPAGR